MRGHAHRVGAGLAVRSRLGGQKSLSSAGMKSPFSNVRAAVRRAGTARAPRGGGARAIIARSGEPRAQQEGVPSSACGGPKPASHIASRAIYHWLPASGPAVTRNL